jgi:hypothetical protein
MSLRTAAPRPTLHRVAPAYPRVLALGAILLAGCGGIVDKDAAKAQPQVQTPVDSGPLPFPADGGTAAPPFDSGPPDTGLPDPAGDIAYPYDSAPPPVTTPPVPVDTGVDDTDPSFGGGAPAPFETGTEPGTDPAPVDAGPAPSL